MRDYPDETMSYPDAEARSHFRKAPFMKSLMAYGCVGLMAAIGIVLVMRLWKADLRVPFFYSTGGVVIRGDLLEDARLVKAIGENGWYRDDPRLGTPHGIHLQDIPTQNLVQIALLKVMILLAGDFGLVLNLYFLAGFVLVALSALFVLRRFGVSAVPAAIASLLYAFLPYHFFRGENHLSLAGYFLVPEGILLALWLSDGSLRCSRRAESGGPALGRQMWLAIAICVLLGSTDAYYAFFTCFLLAAAAASAFAKRRSAKTLAVGLLLISIISASLALGEFPTIWHAFHRTANFVFTRSLGDSETYGLKIVQMLLPIEGHRLPPFARLHERYHAQAPLVNENEAAALGVFGSAGFLFLLAIIFGVRLRSSHPRLLRQIAFLALAALLLATTGGFGTLVAVVISPQIRGYNRISIFIGFLALFALALIADDLWRKPKTRSGRAILLGTMLGVLLLGCLDQTSEHFVPPYEDDRMAFQSDAEFVGRIEERLPSGAMVFQLPYVPFPESPEVYRMSAYDHFRAYLHSHTLRWSFGALKGGEGDAWQRRVAGASSTEDLLKELALAAFSGLYIDRFGYPDGGGQLIAALSRSTGGPPLESRNHRLVFVDIRRFASALRQTYSTEGWEKARQFSLEAPPPH